jgi:hypothetical protein
MKPSGGGGGWGLALVLGLQAMLCLALLGGGWECWRLQQRVARLETGPCACATGDGRRKRESGVAWEGEGIVLPTYSRVPVHVLAQFCEKAIGYCARQSLSQPLRGPPGPKGSQGAPGKRGRRGKCPASCPARPKPRPHSRPRLALLNSSLGFNYSEPRQHQNNGSQSFAPAFALCGAEIACALFIAVNSKDGNESLLSDSDQPPPRHRPLQRLKSLRFHSIDCISMFPNPTVQSAS